MAAPTDSAAPSQAIKPTATLAQDSDRDQKEQRDRAAPQRLRRRKAIVTTSIMLAGHYMIGELSGQLARCAAWALVQVEPRQLLIPEKVLGGLQSCGIVKRADMEVRFARQSRRSRTSMWNRTSDRNRELF